MIVVAHKKCCAWLECRYNSVHKIHHEFKAPIGLVASYCHPFEMFLSNVLPLTGGMVLMQSHVFSGLTWAVFAVLGTQTCEG